MIKTQKGLETYNELSSMECKAISLRHAIEDGINNIYKDAEKGARWLNTSELKQTFKGEHIARLLSELEAQCEELRRELGRNSDIVNALTSPRE